MRALAAFGLTIVSLFAAEVRAGTVRFAPDHAELDISDPRPISFEAAIYSADGHGFTSVDVVFGGELPISLLCNPDACPFTWQDSGFYKHDLLINISAASPIPSGSILGTVQVDPRGAPLSIGQVFTVVVDPQFDGFSGIQVNRVWEPVSGHATITVVPEPATLAILGLSLLGRLRHRRKAKLDPASEQILVDTFASRGGMDDYSCGGPR